MHVTDWLEQIERDYLATFVASGGAAVKFVVGDGMQRSAARHGLTKLAKDRGYLVLSADAASHRFHMPQDLFFAIAAQVDWRMAARRYLINLLQREGYQTDDITPADEHALQAVAERNKIGKEFLLTALNPRLQRDVFYDANMAKDFRVAMSHLCLMERSAEQPHPGQPIIDWLTGVNTRISNVKPFSIYNPINRTTARHLLRSAFYWFSKAGYPGTVVILDSTRVTGRTRPSDGSRYYTRAMTMDFYEIMREFIDSVDLLVATMIVSCSEAAFLDQEADRQSRGVGIYPALQTRIIDDVRDKRIENPAAALCRLMG
ncbi:MAG: DUF2791 family P-loop domain-containing protein [Spirochaetaceae bacterium]|nr:DUF2791 family P-loop domain-containing protein [Spirochaetaceae bacterium]